MLGVYATRPLNLMGLNASTSSLEVALTNNQIDASNGCLDKFKAGDYEIREKFVQDFLSSFKRAYTQGVVFDETTVRTVCALSAVLDHSYTFLAYLAAPLWQNNQTSNKEINPPNLKSDGWGVCMLFIYYWGLQLKARCAFDRQIVLTDKHINMLEQKASKFLSSNTNKQEKIVEEAANTIKSI